MPTSGRTFVRSPELKIPLRAVAVGRLAADRAAQRLGRGRVDPPRRARVRAGIRFASVHHTAGTNDYSPAQAAAIMRGIQIYHVKSNGWNDIGYNFLVDRYGTVYEGRYGGIDRNVVGAHARGFNTGSVGVAVIGTFADAAIPAAAEASLEKLLAWRLDLAHVDPLSSLTVVSGGSERYPAGMPVVLRAVSGHRDTGLDRRARATSSTRGSARSRPRRQAIGLPKLYEPKVTGGLGGPVRFQARVSAPLAWKVTVTDALGQELATGSGRGPTVDWTWDASLVAAAGVRWRIDVAGATPVAGTLGKAVVAAAARDHGARGRSGDDQPERRRRRGLHDDHLHDDRGRDRHRDPARRERRAAGGDPAGDSQPAGEHTFDFDGLGQPDGVYTIVLSATDAAGSVGLATAPDRDLAHARLGGARRRRSSRRTATGRQTS